MSDKDSIYTSREIDAMLTPKHPTTGNDRYPAFVDHTIEAPHVQVAVIAKLYDGDKQQLDRIEAKLDELIAALRRGKD